MNAIEVEEQLTKWKESLKQRFRINISNISLYDSETVKDFMVISTIKGNDICLPDNIVRRKKRFGQTVKNNLITTIKPRLSASGLKA